ncbi:MAG TPA: hypothetical protein VEV43_09970 [Actinomycetota bacterium]|nr:hypothetical protein [Actinomycetota bacterium]
MSSMYRPPRRERRFEIVSIDGNATEPERRAIEAALDHSLEAERASREPSLWLRSGRAQGRRLGMYDYRDRFAHEDAWRLSLRMPSGGREYPGLNGRGDAK